MKMSKEWFYARMTYEVWSEPKLNDRQIILRFKPTKPRERCARCYETWQQCKCTGKGGFHTHTNVDFYFRELLFKGIIHLPVSVPYKDAPSKLYISHIQVYMEDMRKCFLITVVKGVIISDVSKRWTTLPYQNDKKKTFNVSYDRYYFFLLNEALHSLVLSNILADIIIIHD